MLLLISKGISFGFAAGVSPGPFMNYLLTTTLTRGWRTGLVVIFAPLISDIPIILFTVVLLGSLGDSAKALLKIVGGLFTLYIAWGTYLQVRSSVNLGEIVETASPTRNVLVKGILMNFLNPSPYIMWGTVIGHWLLDSLEQSIWHGIGFLASFYGTFLGLMALQTLAFDRLGRINPQMTRGLLLLAIVVLALLGLTLITQGLGSIRA